MESKNQDRRPQAREICGLLSFAWTMTSACCLSAHPLVLWYSKSPRPWLSGKKRLPLSLQSRVICVLNMVREAECDSEKRYSLGTSKLWDMGHLSCSVLRPLYTLGHTDIPSVCVYVCAHLLSCVWLSCSPMEYSLSGSSVRGILQARILEWVPFPSPMHKSEKWKWSRSVMSDSSWPHGLQPTRLLHPWDFPGKSTGVGCHFLLQGILTQGSNLRPLHWQEDSLPLNHLGSHTFCIGSCKSYVEKCIVFSFY